MLKAVYDKEAPTKNLVTTITGAITLAVSGFALFGLLSQEQAASLGELLNVVVTAVAGIIAIFKATD